MADILKTLNYKRGSVKAQLTAYRKQSDRIMSSEKLTRKEIIDLETRLVIIEELKLKFDDVQDEIELQVEEDLRDQQYEERGNFYDSLFSLIADIKYVLSESKRSSETPNSQVMNIETPSDILTSNRSQLKLPTIKLPTFDGSPGLWLEFYDIYKSLIHENEGITNTEKFYYLRASLVGEAAGAIQSIGLSSENYCAAWDTLYTRYNNSTLIIDNHVKALFSLNTVSKDSPSALRALLDTTSKHIRCLNLLNEPTQHWDTLIVHMVSTKLDYVSRREWETKCKQLCERPTFSDIAKFLKDRWEILEKLQREHTDKSIKNPSYKHRQVSVANYATNNKKCGFCNTSYHPLYFCKEYAKLSVEQRLREATRRNLCLNCFRDNHKTNFCKSLVSCKTCNKRHNTLLHVNMNTGEQNETEIQSKPISNRADPGESSICNHSTAAEVSILLSTALAHIRDSNGKLHTCRLLLDSASQSSYITRAFCNKLKLTPSQTNIQIIGIAESSTNVGTSLRATIYSMFCQYKASADLLVLDRITANLPVNTFDKKLLQLPKDICLADPDFNESRPIDILIGAELFWTILESNKVSLGNKLPTLYKTKFGWILGGPMPANALRNIDTRVSCLSTTLENLVHRFWEMESVESEKVPLTKEQQDAEMHFQTYTKRDRDGKFIVSLPLKENLKLGNSRQIAERRFHLLERRFRKNNKLKESYAAFLNEYHTLGHMKLVNENSPIMYSYYLPHHAIIREASLTTKIRVVFDASAKTDNGLSLNDIQLIGPTIQSELYAILLRFRTYKYILSGDISKMYRQILLDSSQRSLQRILWRENEHEQLKCYELQTVTYGTGSAPFLATRCIKQLAVDNESCYPKESKIIQQDFYMDDLLTGANDMNELIIMKANIIKILKSGCFELRKFLSNSANLISETFGENDDPFLNLTASENKTLGIIWNSTLDTLRYKSDKFDVQQTRTKRAILARVAKLFDPLGLLAPIVIVAKLIIQNLWRLKISWDEPVDSHTFNQWQIFANDLLELEDLKLPRLVLNTNAPSVQLHGFADASEKAFGACVYLRSVDTDSNIVHIQLLTAKSKVAPLKNVSLPRLELSAALLLAELVARVKQILTITLDKTYYWSDSTIVM